MVTVNEFESQWKDDLIFLAEVSGKWSKGQSDDPSPWLDSLPALDWLPASRRSMSDVSRQKHHDAIAKPFFSDRLKPVLIGQLPKERLGLPL